MFVDVGAGDGVVIRVGGAVVVSDIGERNIPFVYEAIDEALAKTGSREIEAIIVSHAHDDHVKNFALLLESGKYKIKRALLSRNAHWSATDANRAVMSAIRRHHVPLKYVRTGQVFRFGGAKWTILNPSPGAFTKHHQVSNSSVAYALEVNGKRFLFTGDIESGRRARGCLRVAAAGARPCGRAARHAPRLEVRVARLLPRCRQAEERRHLREPGARPSRPRGDPPAPKRWSRHLVHSLEQHGDGDRAGGSGESAPAKLREFGAVVVAGRTA